ncbi:MAG: DNA-binding NtrC family response regulator [Gammaproteobacteria bacterium]|jgi:DNA-binding NtrC family response regulator
MSNILIVEDENIIRNSLIKLMARQGHNVTGAASVSEAEQNSLESYDLIISDLRLPGEPGTGLIQRAAPTPVLIMTSFSTVQSAVDAMKQGAVDYISKPFNHEEMTLTVRRILEKADIEVQNRILKRELAQNYPIHGMIGNSLLMLDVMDRVHRVSPTDATVLILGETGTGKELIARSIHAQSNRANHSLVTVNCAAIADNLIESELFGHEKGAFTGALKMKKGLVETANGGTLFLDEIGELPLEAQSSLLRMLQENEIRRVGSTKTSKVDVRILVATHKNLEEMITEGLFRQDLYYRLNVFEVNMPPLRDRGKDLRLLADSLLTKMSLRNHRKPLTYSDDAYVALMSYDWPGNVRELENIVERAVILSRFDIVYAEDLGIAAQDKINMENNINTKPMSLDHYFVHVVEQHQSQYNETELAGLLGISRKNLWEKRQRLNIPPRP